RCRSPTVTSRPSRCGAAETLVAPIPRPREHGFRADEHRPIDHPAVEQHCIAARARERADDALRPRDVVGGWREAAIDRIDLLRMDAELPAETELPRALAVAAQKLRVVDRLRDAVDRRIDAR